MTLITKYKNIENLFSFNPVSAAYPAFHNSDKKKKIFGSKKPIKMYVLAFFFFFFISVSAFAQINVTTDLLQESEVPAGSSYRGEIVIRNYGTEAGVIKAYQTDAYSTCDGKYFYYTPDSTDAGRSNWQWVTFSPTYFIIPPQSSSRINYAVNVPNDTALKGSYWSMIMVEVVGNEQDIEKQVNSKPTRKKPKLGLTVNYRFANLILTHIQNTGSRKIVIKGINLTKDKDEYLLGLQLENNGEKALRPDISAELFNTGTGAKLSINGTDKFYGIKSVIYPGSCVNQTIKIGSINPGNLKALIVIDAGGEDIFGAEYNLTIGN